jgi:death-on-curing protein
MRARFMQALIGTIGGKALYPTLVEKASALAFSLTLNHGLVDGNKRVSHAALEVFLLQNGYEIDAPVDEQEEAVLNVAAGRWDRAEITTWLRRRVIRRR